MSGLLERAASAFGPPAVAADPRASRHAPSCSAALTTPCRSPPRWPAGCASSPARPARCSRCGRRPRRRARRSGRRRRHGWRHASRPAGSGGGARPPGVAGTRARRPRLAARAVAAVEVPAVIAITGPRTIATDDLLEDEDLIVLVFAADAEPGLEALALAGLQHRTAPVLVQRPLDSPGARPAAMAGWGRLRVEVPGRRPGSQGGGPASWPNQRVRSSGQARCSWSAASSRSSSARSCSGSSRAGEGGGAGAAGGGPCRAGRGAGDARRLWAAVRAGVRRPRAARPTPSVQGAYLALGRAAADRVAEANGARDASVAFPDADSFAPMRVRVTVRERFEVRTGEARRSAPITASAEAELAPPGELAAREAATTARSRSARGSGCAPTSHAPSTVWSAPRAPTGSRC